MTTLFEDFIYDLIEVQSGARMGKDPPSKPKEQHWSYIVAKNRTKRRDQAVPWNASSKEKERIEKFHAPHIAAASQDVRNLRASINMSPINRKRREEKAKHSASSASTLDRLDKNE